MLRGKRLYSLTTGAVLLVALLAYGASASDLFQEEQAFIPAEQVQAAIQTATAQEAAPISGAVYSVEVDANTGEVVEVEEGTEEHIE